MVNRTLNILTGLAISVLVGAAQADPVSSPPPSLSVDGQVSLVYIGSDAADTSYLSLEGILSDIFCNHSTDSCVAASPGDTVNLGTLSENLVFQLSDTTVVNTFDTVNTASDGYYHVKIADNYTDLGVFTIPTSASDAIAALLNTNSIVKYIGFEDRINGDYDYNDFVFALIDPPAEDPVPEPASLFLLGAGLAGLAARGRRKS